MMALSMIFASPVAMKPPRRMASWIGCWHRDPMSPNCGNQARKAACSALVPKERVEWAHTYALTGMLTRGLEAGRVPRS
jgi:hypothetical protein